MKKKISWQAKCTINELSLSSTKQRIFYFLGSKHDSYRMMAVKRGPKTAKFDPHHLLASALYEIGEDQFTNQKKPKLGSRKPPRLVFEVWKQFLENSKRKLETRCESWLQRKARKRGAIPIRLALASWVFRTQRCDTKRALIKPFPPPKLPVIICSNRNSNRLPARIVWCIIINLFIKLSKGVLSIKSCIARSKKRIYKQLYLFFFFFF